ncbi:MAG: hypothetical protein FWC80_06130 [Firmicutes bacterium]|nr:hypothetical protein [Bacillota bacterium]
MKNTPNIMKRASITMGIGLLLCLALSFFVLLSTNAFFAFATAAHDRNSNSNIEAVSHELFGNRQISSAGYLYNFDGSPDFIYLDFTNYGFVILHRETLSLLEYDSKGDLPWTSSTMRKYYGGPLNYFRRYGYYFINVVTGNRKIVEAQESVILSSTIRESLEKEILEHSILRHNRRVRFRQR